MANGSRSAHPNALPNYQNAVILRKKLEKYSLDLSHPKGKHKAIVFKTALGFEQSDWELLEQKILAELPYYEARPTMKDRYGERYKVIMPIPGRMASPEM